MIQQPKFILSYSNRRRDWFWKASIIQINPLGDDEFHVLGAFRPEGVRFSMGIVKLIGFEKPPVK